MKISKPHTYKIAWESSEETPRVVKSDNGKPHFSNPATLESSPKLYVISHGGKPIYVGKTTGPIAARLRKGFKTDGHNGYSGYLWRHHLNEVKINIWILTLEHQDTKEMKDDPSVKRAMDNDDKKRIIEEIIIETVEAEVVLLIHQVYGQWPKYQSEIHFHQSQPTHREIAKTIVNHYGSPQCPTVLSTRPAPTCSSTPITRSIGTPGVRRPWNGPGQRTNRSS